MNDNDYSGMIHEWSALKVYCFYLMEYESSQKSAFRVGKLIHYL